MRNAISFIDIEGRLAVLGISEEFLGKINGQTEFIDIGGESLNCDWGYTLDSVYDTLKLQHEAYALCEYLSDRECDDKLGDYAFHIIELESEESAEDIKLFTTLLNYKLGDDTVQPRIQRI